MPWEPEDGERLCSQRFISGKKSDSVTSPDYVPSIYPKKAEKKAANPTAVDSLARFQRTQRRSISNEQARVAKEKKKENTWKSTQ